MNVAEILRAAAQRVRQGWCQGAMWDRHGNVCALGAIECVHADLFEADTVSSMVEESLGLTQEDAERRPLAMWNDAHGQTGENVAHGLEYAALLWEQEQAQQTRTEAPCATVS